MTSIDARDCSHRSVFQVRNPSTTLHCLSALKQPMFRLKNQHGGVLRQPAAAGSLLPRISPGHRRA